jgi:DNA-binding beta-propeller fold protein YncE
LKLPHWRNALLLALLTSTASYAEGPGPLVLEATIPLGDIKGRIDHLAVDLTHKRLFVAELGNDSVGVIDLQARRVLRTMTGFAEPQGVGYSPLTDELYVANGGNGTVSIFRGEAFLPNGQVSLGNDADNVRIAEQTSQVLVGYGRGALAVIDARDHSRKADIRLEGHPESFQIVPGESRVLVNVPDTAEVAVIDLRAGTQTTSWPLGDLRGNFPMAVDPTMQTTWVVTRFPARLVAFDTHTGARKAVLYTCGDSDDVFADVRRHQLYVSCGSGHIEVWMLQEGRYSLLARLPTRSGARTALFVPELDRLYLAVRQSPGIPAAIQVYRPAAP